jgi:hypothetical protein
MSERKEKPSTPQQTPSDQEQDQEQDKEPLTIRDILLTLGLEAREQDQEQDQEQARRQVQEQTLRRVQDLKPPSNRPPVGPTDPVLKEHG